MQTKLCNIGISTWELLELFKLLNGSTTAYVRLVVNVVRDRFKIVVK